jgi:hypothetical protein
MLRPVFPASTVFLMLDLKKVSCVSIKSGRIKMDLDNCAPNKRGIVQGGRIFLCGSKEHFTYLIYNGIYCV